MGGTAYDGLPIYRGYWTKTRRNISNIIFKIFLHSLYLFSIMSRTECVLDLTNVCVWAPKSHKIYIYNHFCFWLSVCLFVQACVEIVIIAPKPFVCCLREQSWLQIICLPSWYRQVLNLIKAFYSMAPCQSTKKH